LAGCAQARFGVAQALPIDQLREGKTQELVQAAEAASAQKSVHRILAGKSGKDPAAGASSSNR